MRLPWFKRQKKRELPTAYVLPDYAEKELEKPNWRAFRQSLMRMLIEGAWIVICAVELATRFPGRQYWWALWWGTMLAFWTVMLILERRVLIDICKPALEMLDSMIDTARQLQWQQQRQNKPMKGTLGNYEHLN